jgi:hypothetical protein
MIILFCSHTFALEAFNLDFNIIDAIFHIGPGRGSSLRLPYQSQIRVITKLPNSEQSYKGKVKTHKYINRQNQSTTGKL